MIRRLSWCTEQWQNVAQILNNNRIRFHKDFFPYCCVHQHGCRDFMRKTANQLNIDLSETTWPELVKDLVKSKENSAFLNFIANGFSSGRK